MIIVINVSGAKIEESQLNKIDLYFDAEKRLLVDVMISDDILNIRSVESQADEMIKTAYLQVKQIAKSNGVALSLWCGGLVLFIPDIHIFDGPLANIFLSRFDEVSCDKLIIHCEQEY